MSRLPIRLRLTAAFALAMVVVLAAAGLFVYLRLEDSLDESIATTLEARADAFGAAGPGAVGDPEEAFAQLIGDGGRVLSARGGAPAPALGADDLRRAASGPLLVDRRVDGIEGTARVLARPRATATGRAVVVVGQSLDDHDETLSGLITSFAIGGPIAVLLASLAGYGLAAAGLAPVEAMRRRAEGVSLEGTGAELPLPVARDEVRRLGETLNAMLARLRTSFELERRFVADASHELRTPVAVLKTELEGALRSGDYGPGVRDSLVAAVEECDHLAQLAEDLLVVARSGDGELPVRREPLDAGEVAASVRARFEDRARATGRELAADVAAGVRVDADPLRLRQALGNLTDNALRHGAGTVTLSARRVPGGVELEVRDEGPGFPPELAARAFERFSRGDDARTRGGAGLGLAIVAAIARAHGGRARIAEGPGAAVRLEIPDAGGGDAPPQR